MISSLRRFIRSLLERFIKKIFFFFSFPYKQNMYIFFSYSKKKRSERKKNYERKEKKNKFQPKTRKKNVLWTFLNELRKKTKSRVSGGCSCKVRLRVVKNMLRKLVLFFKSTYHKISTKKIFSAHKNRVSHACAAHTIANLHFSAEQQFNCKRFQASKTSFPVFQL